MIRVLSKRKFENYCKEYNITDDNVENVKETAFISILNSPKNTWFGSNEYYVNSYFKNEHHNVLIMTFDDVEHNSEENIAFSEEMADKVISFVEANRDKNFVLHCAAGISRSGAIGTFIRNHVKYDWEGFIKYNPQVNPNARVLRILNKKIWEKKYGKNI